MTERPEDKLLKDWTDEKISDDEYFKRLDKLNKTHKRYKPSLFNKIKGHKVLIISSIVVTLIVLNYIAIYTMKPDQYEKMMTGLIQFLATNPVTIIIVLVIIIPILAPFLFTKETSPSHIVKTRKRPDGGIDFDIWDKDDL